MKSDRKTIDDRPGPVPEILADGDSIIFCLDVLSEHARLIVRCNPDGTVVASIDVGQRSTSQP